jgi:hypothetical protein
MVSHVSASWPVAVNQFKFERRNDIVRSVFLYIFTCALVKAVKYIAYSRRWLVELLSLMRRCVFAAGLHVNRETLERQSYFDHP